MCTICIRRYTQRIKSNQIRAAQWTKTRGADLDQGRGAFHLLRHCLVVLSSNFEAMIGQLNRKEKKRENYFFWRNPFFILWTQSGLEEGQWVNNKRSYLSVPWTLTCSLKTSSSCMDKAHSYPEHPRHRLVLKPQRRVTKKTRTCWVQVTICLSFLLESSLSPPIFFFFFGSGIAVQIYIQNPKPASHAKSSVSHDSLSLSFPLCS